MLTSEQILALSGRELNAAVARYVLKWEALPSTSRAYDRWRDAEGNVRFTWNTIIGIGWMRWHDSHDHAFALLAECGREWAVEYRMGMRAVVVWVTADEDGNVWNHFSYFATPEELPTAIARAVLLAELLPR